MSLQINQFFLFRAIGVDTPGSNRQMGGLTYPSNRVKVYVSVRSATSLVVITILVKSHLELLWLFGGQNILLNSISR